MKKSKFVIMGALLITASLVVAACTPGGDLGNEITGEVTIYKSSSCGCCGLYVKYFKDKSKMNINVINLEETYSIKNELGVPSSIQSCHTLVIDDYFVEGHVPIEAVAKLIEEKPDIAGIALPNMPSGSPGMPGLKTGDFIVYAVDKEGNYEEFMRL